MIQHGDHRKRNQGKDNCQPYLNTEHVGALAETAPKSMGADRRRPFKRSYSSIRLEDPAGQSANSVSTDWISRQICSCCSNRVMPVPPSCFF